MPLELGFEIPFKYLKAQKESKGFRQDWFKLRVVVELLDLVYYLFELIVSWLDICMLDL